MSKKIYVGNLPFSTTEEEVTEIFSAYGEIESLKMIMDRETGRFRGFGFVEMSDDSADNAISNLNGQEFNGRTLKINEARERSNFR